MEKLSFDDSVIQDYASFLCWLLSFGRLFSPWFILYWAKYIKAPKINPKAAKMMIISR
jgi:hypothetical protein